MKTVVALLAALFLVLVHPVAGANAAQQALRMPPPGDCGDRVQAYARTGQPVNAWNIRVTGPGLTEILPGRAGRVFLVFHDDDDDEQRDVFIDDSHPLNVFATVNGRRVVIAVSATDINNRVTYCTKNIPFNHNP
ncbi:hypothetical protein ACIA8G_42480 [Lentzea sp. NPDC051213]|uniref:hypothetical protein n=1 Tax=Lentzea sp. NPDC051213 TaxID=3364126 RepID=UPI0037A187BF